MKKFIISFLLLTSFHSFAATKKGFAVSEDFPTEFDLIVTTLQVEDEHFYDEFLATIQDIDKSAQFMRKDDIKQIAKVEIYKSLLIIPRISNPQVDKSSLAAIDTLIQKTNKPMLKWFLAAIRKDVESIINDSSYSELSLVKANSLELKKIEHRRLERKIQLIAPWLRVIQPADEDALSVLMNKLRPLMKDSLKNVAKSFQTLFIQQNLQAKIVPDTMTFFKVIDISDTPIPIQKVEKKSTSVEEILAPVLKDAPVDLPLPSDEDWLSQ